MYRRLKRIFIMGVSTLTVFSCKKTAIDPPVEFKINYISDELKEWGLFKTGSYWIYKDTITGQIDSVYVNSVDHSIYSYVSNDGIKDEKIKVNFHSNNGFSSYTLQPDGFIVGDNRIKTFYVETTPVAYSGISINTILPTYTVFDSIFTNVRHMGYDLWETVHSSGFSVYEENYWKRNVGIIERKAQLQYYGGYTQHLKLLRYHAIQ